MDLNAQLSDYAATCKARAAADRADAADLRARPELHNNADSRAKARDASAARWQARAKAAGEGKLLVFGDKEGIGDRFSRAALYDELISAGRGVHVHDDGQPYRDHTGFDDGHNAGLEHRIAESQVSRPDGGF
jgi:hypothetical protein